MLNIFRNKKKFIAGLLLITLLSIFFLVACTGRTVIDVNIDPTTGSGDIVINPPEEDGQIVVTDNTNDNSDMSQIALFAVIAALFIGVVAIVIAVSRRPSDRERLE